MIGSYLVRAETQTMTIVNTRDTIIAGIHAARDLLKYDRPRALAELNARAKCGCLTRVRFPIMKKKIKLHRFYEFVRAVNHETFDVEQVTHHEFEWWVAHRELFGQKENQPVVDAFRNLNASLFQVDEARVAEAAYWRALSPVDKGVGLCDIKSVSSASARQPHTS